MKEGEGMKKILAFVAAALLAFPAYAKGVSEAAAPAAASAGVKVSREVVPLERNGIKLHLAKYQAEGSEKPLLLVHGLTYSSHEFDVDYGDYSLTRYLAAKGFVVWLLDIAGYGESGAVEDGFMPDSDYAAEDIAAAAAVIIADSGAGKIDVLGWSWGTVTSGRFAARYPDRVNRLVLYAPIVAALGPVTVDTPFHANDWNHAADDFQKLADGAIDYGIVERPVADTYLSNCWRFDGKGSPAGGRRDLLADSTVRLIPVADIQAPVLLILGDKDPYIGVDLAREALAALPQGEIHVIPGASHAMMMEKPYYKEFRETVLAFLTK